MSFNDIKSFTHIYPDGSNPGGNSTDGNTPVGNKSSSKPGGKKPASSKSGDNNPKGKSHDGNTKLCPSDLYINLQCCNTSMSSFSFVLLHFTIQVDHYLIIKIHLFIIHQ